MSKGENANATALYAYFVCFAHLYRHICTLSPDNSSPVLAVAYSPDATLIAVGLHGGGVSVLKPSEDDPSILLLEKVTFKTGRVRSMLFLSRLESLLMAAALHIMSIKQGIRREGGKR